MSERSERKAIDKVFILLGIAAALFLAVIGGLAYYGHYFATSMVREQLGAQKIYFPLKTSQAYTSLPAVDRAAMAPYAGQQLVTGDQAKVYADNYIAVHLERIGGGKTYAEISQAATAHPADQQLQAQRSLLFQGETLRGMLLGSGYAFWTIGMIAYYASLAAFAGAIAMLVLVALGLRHLKRL